MARSMIVERGPAPDAARPSAAPPAPSQEDSFFVRRTPMKPRTVPPLVGSRARSRDGRAPSSRAPERQRAPRAADQRRRGYRKKRLLEEVGRLVRERGAWFSPDAFRGGSG